MRYETKRTIAVGAGALAIAGAAFAYSQTASCSRWQKSFDSSMTGGMNRVVNVYSMDGELLATYVGYFDVTYDSSRILFDDEYGRRHQIYVGNGTATIDEISDEEYKELQEDGKVKVYTKTNENV